MYIYITESNQVGKFLTALAEESINCISLDTETTGLDIYLDKITLLQVQIGEEVFIFNWQKLGQEFMTYIIRKIYKAKDKVIYGHNIRFDAEFIAVDTGIFLERLYCTMIMEVLLYNGLPEILGGGKYFSLAELVERYFGKVLDKTIRESFYKDFNGEITEEMLTYAEEDVRFLQPMAELQREALRKAGMRRVIDEIESPFTTVAAASRVHGIKLNKKKWRTLVEIARREADEIEVEVKDDIFKTIVKKYKFENAWKLFEYFHVSNGGKKFAKRDILLLEGITEVSMVRDSFLKYFNLGSYVQATMVLNEVFGLKVENTNAKTLDKIKHPFVRKLQAYREADKAATSFGENYIQKIHPMTGRIHYTLNQIGADTGRTSAEDPSLQNIKREKVYREPFEAEEGWLIADVDYSQQEYRTTGALSKEPVIIKAYQDGLDMHITTASNVFHVSIADVTKELRQNAKTYNFAIIYGANEWGLSYSQSIPLEEAEKIVKEFWDGYPVLKKYKKKFVKLVMRDKFSTTMTGRRRYFEDPYKGFYPDEKTRYRYERKLEKEGFNHAIQGTGVDMIKLAANRIYYTNPFKINVDFKLILIVHDEIYNEVREEISVEAMEFIKKCMLEVEQEFLGDIPAAVEGELSQVWSH